MTKVRRNVAQYHLHHVTYVYATFKVATANDKIYLEDN